MTVRGDWDGFDLVEHVYRGQLPSEHEDQLEPLELDADTVSFALLVEMRRPPWWRELDQERRAIALEAAS